MRISPGSTRPLQNKFTPLAFLLLWQLAHPATGQLEAGDLPPATRGEALVFEKDVLPLLRENCLRCHGEKKKKGGLDLRSADSILRGGESGEALVPGKPDESRLIELISNGEMPPGKKTRLEPGEEKLIRSWIEGGARSLQHPQGAPLKRKVTEHDITPLLLLRCTVCHGGRKKEGGLDLRTRESMLKGGESGPAMIPGKPEESLMIKKIRGGKMPPARKLVVVSVKMMRPGELELLERCWLCLFILFFRLFSSSSNLWLRNWKRIAQQQLSFQERFH